MFPSAGDQVYYNEAGEPIGWDKPDDDGMAYYCGDCGFSHTGSCPDPYDEYYISEESFAADRDRRHLGLDETFDEYIPDRDYDPRGH